MRETPIILIVDDDPGILELVQDILSSSYQIVTASSVQEAKEYLRDHGCGLVLTDMVMPEVGGLELLKYLRLHHADIPVIVFTGYANFQDAVNAVKLGAFDYLTKPIQIEILQHAIARALEFRRLQSQQKDLEVVFRGAETLGWQALDLISGTKEAALLTSLRDSWAEAATMKEVGQRFLEGIDSLLEATRTSIFLYDEQRDNFTALVAKGPEDEARLIATVPADNSLMGHVANLRRPLLVTDLELDQSVALYTRRFPYFSKSFIIIPLMGSKFWGVLNLTDRRDQLPFTPRDLFLAWLFGHLLVEALEAKGVARETALFPPLGTLLEDHFHQGVALVDQDLRIIQANSALVKLLRTKGDPVGQELSTLLGLAPEERENLKNVLAWVMEYQESRELPTLKCFLEEGKTHFLGVNVIPSLHPRDSQHGIVVVEDLSELEKLRQRLRLYEHLAIMGKLSLCVAHELNNPLDGVYRFLSLAQKKKDDPREVERYLTEAQKGLQKMSMTIRSLLSSANPLKAPPKTDSMLNLLQEAVKIMMFQASDQRVQVSLHAPKALQQVPVEGDLYHVFINIIKNALQAMPQGGKLQVDGDIGSEDIALHFQDTGSGLTHEELGQIFQPFYSTKEGTRGLGLGLPICRKILERYNGQLIVESQPGKGTRVTILLPKSGLGENLAS